MSYYIIIRNPKIVLVIIEAPVVRQGGQLSGSPVDLAVLRAELLPHRMEILTILGVGFKP